MFRVAGGAGSRVTVACAMAGVLVAGCSFRDNRQYDRSDAAQEAPGLTGLLGLRVDPPKAAVVIDNGMPATQPFRALANFSDGRTDVDVTALVGWLSANEGLATINSGVATTGTQAGGEVTMTARAGGISGTAVLQIKLLSITANTTGSPALPADAAAKFAGLADATRAPQLVYPNDGVLLPPNLYRIEIHYRPGSASNTLFEIGFRNDVTDVRVITRCIPLSDGCLFEPSRQVWSYIAETNRGRAPLRLTVRGTDDTGMAVGASASFGMQFSADVIRGALYYWTTSQGTAIMRWNFNDTTQTMAEKVAGRAQANNRCIGCHALSRDGKKMVLSADGIGNGDLLLLDVATKLPLQMFPLPQRSQFESWNKTGSQFVGVYGDGGEKDLMLFDGNTGLRMMPDIDVGAAQADHPDWSPDGNRIAFTDVGEKHSDQRPGLGGISYVELDATGAWSAPKVLVPQLAGENHYYPTIAPDNSFVLYNRSLCPTGSTYDRLCNADTDPTAQMWAVRFPPAAGTPVELAQANAPGVEDKGETKLTNSFPKWCPFVFNLSEQRKLMWVTVSSSRQYGLRNPPAGGSENPKGTLLWMAGVEPAKLASGADPSFPAFCLPFQDIKTSNHIAQWTSDVPKIE